MEQQPSNEQHPGSLLRRLGRSVINFAQDLRKVMSSTDTNPHEGKLRRSAAPKEYLGLDYDNLPRPEDNQDDEKS